MKSVIFEQFGEPRSVLKMVEEAEPVPQRGELLVSMLASPVNPSDLMTIRGVYGIRPKLPATPGYEGVGIVQRSGGGIYGKLLIGKRVAVLNSSTGNWREKTVIPARQAIPLSSSLTLDQAAMFFVNPVTAYVMTRRILDVPNGAWVLQTAATSSLGKMVIRLGQKYGFRTVNLVRRAEAVDELQNMGADAVVVYNGGPIDDLVSRVRKATDGAEIRHALDPVGGETATAALQALAPSGRLLLYGSLVNDPMTVSSRLMLTTGCKIEGFWLSRYMAGLGIVAKLRLVKKVSRLIEEGVLTSEAGNRYPLERVNEAVKESETVGRGGKTLLVMNESVTA